MKSPETISRANRRVVNLEVNTNVRERFLLGDWARMLVWKAHLNGDALRGRRKGTETTVLEVGMNCARLISIVSIRILPFQQFENLCNDR